MQSMVYKVGNGHRNRKEIPELLYSPYQTTHAETNANKMRPQSPHAVQHFWRVNLPTQTAALMHLTNHDYFDRK